MSFLRADKMFANPLGVPGSTINTVVPCSQAFCIRCKQSISENSKESSQTPDSNEEIIQDSAINEDEGEFSNLYNPPEGGSLENVGKIIFCLESEETEDLEEAEDSEEF